MISIQYELDYALNVALTLHHPELMRDECNAEIGDHRGSRRSPR
jgi:hypothetical protein